MFCDCGDTGLEYAGLIILYFVIGFICGLVPAAPLLWQLQAMRTENRHLLNEVLRKNGSRTLREEKPKLKVEDDEGEADKPNFKENIVGRAKNPLAQLQEEMIAKDNEEAAKFK